MKLELKKMEKGRIKSFTLFIRSLFIIFFTVVLIVQTTAQNSSLIVLGDLHYDLMVDHDLNWVRNKPDDIRQINEYTAYTKENWDHFMTVLKKRVQTVEPEVKAVVQLGDLSEGLAGTEEKAGQMASHAMDAIRETQMGVPWIIAKGNHDITGPGAVKAFLEYYVPVFREQTNNPEIHHASYTYRYDNIQITCVDPWDKEIDMIAFLDRELSESNAKFKFIAIHEPVIPVTERCWHVLRNEPQKREKLLEVIARNKAVVLCGHLHKYSVVCRKTKYGTIVQVMAISVVSDRNYKNPTNVIREYGASLAESVSDWQPETLNTRKAILAEEAKYVTYFKQTDLPGYAILTMDEKENKIMLKYYAAFGEKPFDTVDLTGLLHP